ncbi:hypothetical protein GF407_16830 [candidate division KSB1 bacterium]|nr:hypothetical protein [candidate division KSB1 bacterium]
MKTLLEWFKRVCSRQLEGCRRRTSEGTVFYTPDGNGAYNAMWLRDFYYMVENCSEAIPSSHMKWFLEKLAKTQRKDGCIADRIELEGTPVYCAGPPGRPVGEPPTDNSQFFVLLVEWYISKSDDLDFFRQHEMVLNHAFDFIPRSASGLVYIKPGHRQSPYGFTDTVAKSGDLFFSSLLLWQAYRAMASFYQRCNCDQKGKAFQQKAETVEKKILQLWDKDSGMFYAASGDCRQIDIWGNAYALYIHFPLEDKAERIADYMSENFDSIVLNGQIRHLPGGQYWHKTLIPVLPDTYQNGAYWGTASGWVAYALQKKYYQKTEILFQDLARNYKENGIYECIHGKYKKEKNYIASIINPFGALKKILNES